MFARAVRINKHAGAWDDQVAYVFVPDDVVMREIVQDIQAEQIRHAKDSEARSNILPPGAGAKMPRITPLSSAATNQREATLNEIPLTPKQEEENILRAVETHIRRYAFANRLEARTINTELVREFRKPRRQMYLHELKYLLNHIYKAYPLGSVPRGTGTPRVSPRPEYVQAELFDTEFMKGFEY
jgi:hypothetical protein